MGNRNDHDDEDDDDGEEYPRRFSSDYGQDEEFDAQEEDEPRRGLLAFVIALGILLIVSTVIWNAYRQGVREGGRDGTPRITAQGPVKIAPEDPGGATVPGQDVAVYDEIEGAQAAGAASDAAPPLETSRTPDAAAPPQELASAAPVKPAAPAGGPAVPAAAPPSAGSISFSRGGPFVAQIAALRTQEAADAEWAKISRVAPDLFRQAQKDIQRADLGAKGVFYRLRAGSFASRDAANAFCDQVQAAGQGCIVAAR